MPSLSHPGEVSLSHGLNSPGATTEKERVSIEYYRLTDTHCGLRYLLSNRSTAGRPLCSPTPADQAGMNVAGPVTRGRTFVTNYPPGFIARPRVCGSLFRFARGENAICFRSTDRHRLGRRVSDRGRPGHGNRPNQPAERRFYVSAELRHSGEHRHDQLGPAGRVGVFRVRDRGRRGNTDRQNGSSNTFDTYSYGSTGLYGTARSGPWVVSP